MCLCECVRASAFNPFHTAFSDYYYLSIVVTVCCLYRFTCCCFFSRLPSLLFSLVHSLRIFSPFGIFYFISNELVSLLLIVQFYICTHTSPSVVSYQRSFCHILFRIFVASSILCIWWLNEREKSIRKENAAHQQRERQELWCDQKKATRQQKEIMIGGATEMEIAEEATWIPLSDFDFSPLSQHVYASCVYAVDAALSICQVE